MEGECGGWGEGECGGEACGGWRGGESGGWSERVICPPHMAKMKFPFFVLALSAKTKIQQMKYIL